MKRIITFLLIVFSLMCTSCDKKMEAKSTSIVIVGMETSAKYGKCPGCNVDVANMTGILSQYGTPVVLQNGKARKSAVIAALSSAVNSDLCIFYYSGHGGSDPFKDTPMDTTETDGKDEYLCLYDNYMRDNEIWSIISGAKGRVMLIFDCCHSETMFRSCGITMDGIVVPQGSKVNMLCWSGCPDDTYSYGGSNGGAMTCSLKGGYKKDRSYDEVWKEIVSRTKGQTPKRTQIGEGFGGKVFR